MLGSLSEVTTNFNSKTRNKLLAVISFFFFFGIYSFTSRASVVSSDEVAVFGTSVNLATQHVLNIDNLKEVERITNIGKKSADNHFYAKYFPGNIFSAAVIYRLTAKMDDIPYIWSNPKYGSFVLAPSERGARIALRLNALLGALGMALLFITLTKYFHWKTAMITILLIGLTTDWWYYSRTFFSEIGAGAFLIASLYFAVEKRSYLSSLFLAVSILFRPTNLLTVPIWGYSIWRNGSKKVFSGIYLFGSLGALALYNYVRFHTFYDFGYGEEGFTTPIVEGLKGVLLSPGHSLFIYSPILIVVFFGGILFYKQNKPVTLLILFCTIGYIIAVATWGSWSGGKVWGTRLVIPIFPMMGMLVAPVIDKLFDSPDRNLFILILFLGILGFCIQLLTIIQNPMITINHFVDGGYATQLETIWSVNKSWLALQIKSLTDWNTCNIDAYSLRMMFPQCR